VRLAKVDRYNPETATLETVEMDADSLEYSELLLDQRGKELLMLFADYLQRSKNAVDRAWRTYVEGDFTPRTERVAGADKSRILCPCITLTAFTLEQTESLDAKMNELRAASRE
jgi:hypothetical protein